jgi:hypothetical protein
LLKIEEHGRIHCHDIQHGLAGLVLKVCVSLNYVRFNQRFGERTSNCDQYLNFSEPRKQIIIDHSPGGAAIISTDAYSHPEHVSHVSVVFNLDLLNRGQQIGARWRLVDE